MQIESQQLDLLLNQYFDSKSYRSAQKEIIESILEGNDTFVRFPTGMGKSLCYQLPSLILPGIVVVVSPLIALMKDQVDNLIKKGIPAAYLNSTIPTKRYNAIKEDCKNGNYKILYISPEGLIKEFTSFISLLPVSLFAIDEAHTIMQWGFDFRPQYSQLKILKDSFRSIPIVALTASVTPEAQENIIQILGMCNARVYTAPLVRENISLSVKRNVSSKEKIDAIVKLHHKHRLYGGIVYCNTRRTANSIANKLKYRNINALSYHAGISKKQRELVQQQFIAGEVNVICATIAFGMGIDKSDIRWIVHYNTPQNIETYYQEVGRAGRDGELSDALLFCNNEDNELIETFAQRSGNVAVNLDKLRSMNDYARTKKCRWQYIINYFGETEHISNCRCDNCIANM